MLPHFTIRQGIKYQKIREKEKENMGKKKKKKKKSVECWGCQRIFQVRFEKKKKQKEKIVECPYCDTDHWLVTQEGKIVSFTGPEEHLEDDVLDEQELVNEAAVVVMELACPCCQNLLRVDETLVEDAGDRSVPEDYTGKYVEFQTPDDIQRVTTERPEQITCGECGYTASYGSKLLAFNEVENYPEYGLDDSEAEVFFHDEYFDVDDLSADPGSGVARGPNNPANLGK